MTEKKILHLTLKKKFFDMIASGEKKEEYRAIKPYWVSRLVNSFHSETREGDFTFLWRGFLSSMESPKHYDCIEFKHGYSKDAPIMIVECIGIKDGFTKLKWADKYEPAFIIKLGKIISIKNYNPICQILEQGN